MGRVTNQSPAAPPSSPLTHFTHPHELHPLSLNSPQSLCSGCKLQSSGIMYTCIPCTFTLHQSCAKLPRRITHPSHTGCTLTLLTTASYPGGIFNCDACSRQGDGWSYHCTRCEYDLHVTCASKPLEIRHQAHRSCDLQLTFKNPYVNANGFSCDICRKIGSKQWLYRCNSCEFDVHLYCTTAPAQPTLQHHHSLLAAATQVNGFMVPPPQQQQPHLMHSASTGAIGINPYNQYHGGQVIHGSVPGNQQMMMQNGLGTNLMMAAVQGFVEGAFQEVGQAVVQEVIGGGGGDVGGGGYDGGGGDVSSY